MNNEQIDAARYNAAQDAWHDMLCAAGPCGGSGYVYSPCSERHAYLCGGPDCDGGEECDCPGCDDCDNEEQT